MKLQEWFKGGIRYQRLKKNVDQLLEEDHVEALFLGLQGRAGILFALNPLSVVRREYVVALTSKDVVVLRVNRPAVFGSKLQGVLCRTSRSAVRIKGKQVLVGEELFTPLPFHWADAEELVEHARG